MSEVKFLFFAIIVCLAGYGGYSLYEWGWNSRDEDFQAHLEEDENDAAKKKAAYEAQVALEVSRTEEIQRTYDADVDTLTRRLQELPTVLRCPTVRIPVTSGVQPTTTRPPKTSGATIGVRGTDADEFYGQAMRDISQCQALIKTFKP